MDISNSLSPPFLRLSCKDLLLTYRARCLPLLLPKAFKNTLKKKKPKNQQYAASHKGTCHFSLGTNGLPGRSTWHPMVHTQYPCASVRSMDFSEASEGPRITSFRGNALVKGRTLPTYSRNSCGCVIVKIKFPMVCYRHG